MMLFIVLDSVTFTPQWIRQPRPYHTRLFRGPTPPFDRVPSPRAACVQAQYQGAIFPPDWHAGVLMGVPKRAESGSGVWRPGYREPEWVRSGGLLFPTFSYY
jgi:hypothetical protein